MSSSIYNASVAVYDLFTADLQDLTFPEISHTKTYHMAGVDYDVHSGAMFFTATNGLAFEANGVDISGPQKVIKWDTTAMEAVYIADLAPFQEQYKSTFGHVTAGFQDIAEDSNGKSYAPASFGGYSIAKIAPNGTVTPIFMSNETAKNATASPYLCFGLVSLPS